MKIKKWIFYQDDCKFKMVANTPSVSHIILCYQHNLKYWYFLIAKKMWYRTIFNSFNVTASSSSLTLFYYTRKRCRRRKVLHWLVRLCWALKFNQSCFIFEWPPSTYNTSLYRVTAPHNEWKIIELCIYTVHKSVCLEFFFLPTWLPFQDGGPGYQILQCPLFYWQEMSKTKISHTGAF